MNEVRSLVAMAHVLDVSRSIEFYRKLGFEVGNTFTPDGAAEPTWVWLRRNEAHLMLAKASHPVDAAVQAVLFYVYCDDVPAMRAALEMAHIDVGAIQYPFYAPRGEFRATDPDGYVLMITHT
ncbi:MAG TPA: VOC family protein [Thermoanaerobaculia bacterium]|nr:VOC family protein [Thermoanaerobaculia bacterium]